MEIGWSLAQQPYNNNATTIKHKRQPKNQRLQIRWAVLRSHFVQKIPVSFGKYQYTILPPNMCVCVFLHSVETFRTRSAGSGENPTRKKQTRIQRWQATTSMEKNAYTHTNGAHTYASHARTISRMNRSRMDFRCEARSGHTKRVWVCVRANGDGWWVFSTILERSQRQSWANARPKTQNSCTATASME